MEGSRGLYLCLPHPTVVQDDKRHLRFFSSLSFCIFSLHLARLSFNWIASIEEDISCVYKPWWLVLMMALHGDAWSCIFHRRQSMIPSVHLSYDSNIVCLHLHSGGDSVLVLIASMVQFLKISCLGSLVLLSLSLLSLYFYLYFFFLYPFLSSFIDLFLRQTFFPLACQCWRVPLQTSRYTNGL